MSTFTNQKENQTETPFTARQAIAMKIHSFQLSWNIQQSSVLTLQVVTQQHPQVGILKPGAKASVYKPIYCIQTWGLGSSAWGWPLTRGRPCTPSATSWGGACRGSWSTPSTLEVRPRELPPKEISLFIHPLVRLICISCGIELLISY